MVGRPLLAMLALSGCGVEDWRNADLQLDIQGASVSDEDRVRICVAGVGMLETALGDGKVGFTGIPEGLAVEVTVDSLGEPDQRLGRAGPVQLTEDSPLAVVEWSDCEDDCAACQTPGGSLAPEGAESWLLAVRMIP